MDVGEPTLANASHEDYERLPRTLWDAVGHPEDDDVLVDSPGENLVTAFVELERDEFDRSRDHVNEWEREEYLDEF